MKKAVFTLILALCLAILTPFASFAQTDDYSDRKSVV